MLVPFILATTLIVKQPTPQPSRRVHEVGFSVAKLEATAEPIPSLPSLEEHSVEAIQPIRSLTVESGSPNNPYTPFNCTWGVASWVKVPPDLGNADTWAVRGSEEGYTVSSQPLINAVAVSIAGRWGHVALVVDFAEDKVLVREMNWKGLGITSMRWANKGDFEYVYFD